jgi:hypothetical protein
MAANAPEKAGYYYNQQNRFVEYIKEHWGK